MRYALQTIGFYGAVAVGWLLSIFGTMAIVLSTLFASLGIQWSWFNRKRRLNRARYDYLTAERHMREVFQDARQQMDAVSRKRSDAYIPDLGNWREW